MQVAGKSMGGARCIVRRLWEIVEVTRMLLEAGSGYERSGQQWAESVASGVVQGTCESRLCAS